MSLLYRIFLGFYIALHNEEELAALIIIGLSIGFILYNITNLPFSNVYQSYRANIIHLSHFVILMVTNYYRSMKSTTPLNVKSRLHTAAIVELGVIGFCVLISFAVLVYELVLFFKKVHKYCRKKKKRIKDERSQTEESINDIQMKIDN